MKLLLRELNLVDRLIWKPRTMQKKKRAPNVWIKFTSVGYVSFRGFGYENVSISNIHPMQVMLRRRIGWIQRMLRHMEMRKYVSHLFM